MWCHYYYYCPPWQGLPDTVVLQITNYRGWGGRGWLVDIAQTTVSTSQCVVWLTLISEKVWFLWKVDTPTTSVYTEANLVPTNSTNTTSYGLKWSPVYTLNTFFEPSQKAAVYREVKRKSKKIKMFTNKFYGVSMYHIERYGIVCICAVSRCGKYSRH